LVINDTMQVLVEQRYTTTTNTVKSKAALLSLVKYIDAYTCQIVYELKGH